MFKGYKKVIENYYYYYYQNISIVPTSEFMQLFIAGENTVSVMTQNVFEAI